MTLPCPFCKKKFESPASAVNHFHHCEKYKRWRATHTNLQYQVFMHTGWRKKAYFPEFSATKPICKISRKRLVKHKYKKKPPKTKDV